MSENSLPDEGQDKNDPLSLPSDSHVTHDAAQTAIEHTTNMSTDGSTRYSNIVQLWQFVKELLSQPQHSGCIYWIDRDQGIFKIIDSVKVAQLWGKRKNRPAMDFEKLSRSLRQYYKKGIMKKTKRPERLVYQFCAPYHL